MSDSLSLPPEYFHLQKEVSSVMVPHEEYFGLFHPKLNEIVDTAYYKIESSFMFFVAPPWVQNDRRVDIPMGVIHGGIAGQRKWDSFFKFHAFVFQDLDRNTVRASLYTDNELNLVYRGLLEDSRNRFLWVTGNKDDTPSFSGGFDHISFMREFFNNGNEFYNPHSENPKHYNYAEQDSLLSQLFARFRIYAITGEFAANSVRVDVGRDRQNHSAKMAKIIAEEAKHTNPQPLLDTLGCKPLAVGTASEGKKDYVKITPQDDPDRHVEIELNLPLGMLEKYRPTGGTKSAVRAVKRISFLWIRPGFEQEIAYADLPVYEPVDQGRVRGRWMIRLDKISRTNMVSSGGGPANPDRPRPHYLYALTDGNMYGPFTFMKGE